MDRPAELIRRASRKILLPHREEQPSRQEEERIPAPRPVSRHASYTALMQSHDRVHTRHLRPS